MTDDDPAIYSTLLRIKPDGLSLNAWTVAAGVSRPFFNDLRKHGRPRRETLAKVLGAIGWTPEQFERELSRGLAGHIKSGTALETRETEPADLAGAYKVLSEVRGAGAVGFDEMKQLVFGDEPLAPLPLYGSAQGGSLDEDFALTELDLSEVLDYLRRPAGLADDGDSYALTIVGDSMRPRFKPGERVGVSPKARVEIGDDVIVQLRGENTNRVQRVLIKELVRRSATHITLAQHNPARELRIPRTDILAMHKVKGHFL